MRRLTFVALSLLAACGTSSALTPAAQPGQPFVMDCTQNPHVVCVERTVPAATTTTTTTAPTTTRATTTVPAPTTTRPPAPSNWLASNFLIGIDIQPASSATKWAGRGINTLVRIDASVDTGSPGANDAQMEVWDNAAAANGMRTIRQPKTDPRADIGNPTLLAWAPHKDEPDGNFAPTPDKQIPYQAVQARYAELKAIDPARPITIMVTGSFNQNDARYWPNNDPADGAQACCEPWYRKYFAGADWLEADRYPANLGKPLLPDLRTMTNALNTWQEPERAKPFIAYIEASDYDTTANRPAPGPTAAQLRAEVWFVVTEGARGIVYFPFQVAPTFVADALTPAVVSEMTSINAHLKELATVLQGPIDPAGLSVTAPAPLEVGWRAGHVIVVNPTATALVGQRIAVSGSGTVTVLWENRSEAISGGAITDDFAPYAVHVYRTAP